VSEQTDAKKAELSTPGEREIHVERTFEAPRERVFAAYTDPELVPRWWGPYGTTTVVDELDARTGGRWRFLSQTSDGEETAFRGVYREVVAPELIVWTFEWEGMPGYVSLETSRFEDLGDGRTRVIADTVFHTGAERDGMLDSGMERGMNETFARLDELLAG
jgi:uncharacterized protein YndB with AHSA1/START domain